MLWKRWFFRKLLRKDGRQADDRAIAWLAVSVGGFWSFFRDWIMAVVGPCRSTQPTGVG
jgi:hypothetical protein